MKKTLFMFILILLSCNSKKEKIAESNFKIVIPPIENPRNYDEIGFACGEAGSPTDMVEYFSDLITNESFKQLREKLVSSKPGEIYLATFSCRKLMNEEIIQLNAMELQQIQKNLKRNDTISSCSGCTGFESVNISKVLNDSNCSLFKESDWWIDELLGRNIVKQ